MAGVEPASQGSKGWKDELSFGRHEAAARNPPAVDAEAELWMKMAGNLGAMFFAKGFVAEQDSAKLDLVDDGAAAMVGK
jgi:hypothetical protein